MKLRKLQGAGDTEHCGHGTSESRLFIDTLIVDGLSGGISGVAKCLAGEV